MLNPFESPWIATAADGDSALSPEEALPAREAASSPEAPTTMARAVNGATESIALRDAVDAYERQLLLRALAARDYHQGRTADDLQLSYHQLRGLLRKHDLRSRSARG